MKMKTYFMTMKLKSGEFVGVVYKTPSRKGTNPHLLDLYFAASDIGVDWDYPYNKDTATFAHIMNAKNKEEQCFGDNRVIELF